MVSSFSCNCNTLLIPTGFIYSLGNLVAFTQFEHPFFFTVVASQGDDDVDDDAHEADDDDSDEDSEYEEEPNLDDRDWELTDWDVEEPQAEGDEEGGAAAAPVEMTLAQMLVTVKEKACIQNLATIGCEFCCEAPEEIDILLDCQHPICKPCRAKLPPHKHPGHRFEVQLCPLCRSPILRNRHVTVKTASFTLAWRSDIASSYNTSHLPQNPEADGHRPADISEQEEDERRSRELAEQLQGKALFISYFAIFRLFCVEFRCSFLFDRYISSLSVITHTCDTYHNHNNLYYALEKRYIDGSFMVSKISLATSRMWERLFK